MDKNYYKETYIPSIVKWGRIISVLGIIVILLPMAVLRFVFGIEVDSAKLATAVTAQLTLTVVYWVLDPVSAFPAMGIPGTLLSFVSGNVFNMRLPAASAAQKSTEYENGSEESSVVGTVGICCSVFINIAFLTIATLLGSTVLTQVPDSVITVLGYLLPALFGAMYAQYAIDDVFSGVVAMILALVCYKLYEFGLLDSYGILLIMIPIVGAVLLSRVYHTKKAQKEDN